MRGSSVCLATATENRRSMTTLEHKVTMHGTLHTASMGLKGIVIRVAYSFIFGSRAPLSMGTAGGAVPLSG